jgi:hypothetical protein
MQTFLVPMIVLLLSPWSLRAMTTARDLPSAPAPTPQVTLVVPTKHEVLHVCPLCGANKGVLEMAPREITRVEDYCTAKQCQWTKRLEQEHPDWGRQVCLLIGKGTVQIGMTADQAREAWGRPNGINTTVSALGTQEQWIYHVSGGQHWSFLYLLNGIITIAQP